VTTSKGQVARQPASKSPSKQQREAIAKRRGELLERIRNIDPETIRGLTLRVGAARGADDAPAPFADFHDYFFKGPDFIEKWDEAVEAAPETE
jgi:hypothetical protein